MKNKILIGFFFSRYFTLTALIVGSLDGNTQIIYTDIEPDYVSENVGDYYNLDLNNDGIVDFTLKSLYLTNGTFLEISSPHGDNTFIAVFPWEVAIVKPLENGDEVFNLTGLINHEPFGYLGAEGCWGGDGSFCPYNWQGNTDKYLGLGFLINGQSYYGWARLNVTSASQWVIKDYAYNATKDEPIQAGQKVLGLEESNLQKIKVIVSNGQISILNLPDSIKYNLYTLNGQKIGHGDLGQSNSDINVQNLISGIYFIELSTNDSNSIITKKFIIP
ncbi:T9SS type A sorting domain-containing protein [Mariniflexile sp. HNIBRBA6329]|uniref:T9SS type A sorting domain-containing protein n=1 Tax=Mariniflexile sp. HNIBRBA6329 TaxID=3373088 RepID=UPI003746D423